MRKVLFALAGLLMLACQASKETVESPFKQLTSLLEQYGESAVQSGSINSIALAVYRDGDTYQNYFGEIDKNAQNQPNDSTLYEIASISKVFVGSLAARAVVENKITLDDDIRKYLKEEYPNLQYENTPITVKNLLTHTLGFKNRTPEKLEAFNKKVAEGYYESSPIDYCIYRSNHATHIGANRATCIG